MPTAVPLPILTPETAVAWSRASFFRREPGGVVCTLCPYECRLGPEESGRCHVRRATTTGEGMETATFVVAVVHTDPIERKTLYHYRPGLKVLTLAAPGCTFTCSYCINHRLSQWGHVPELPWVASRIDPDTVAATAAEHGVALGFSYSEPTLAAELVVALARAGRARNVPVVWKSNGFITASALAELAPHIAAVNIDLKAPDEKRHGSLTGAPLAPVLASVAGFVRRGVWVEVSTPVIPRFNSDRDSIRRTADHILAAAGPDTPWHLLRFVPDFRLRGLPPTTPDVLADAAEVARSAGFRYVYVERALGSEGRNTHCPGCGSAVIERDVWATRTVHLRDGECPGCGFRIPGRWE